MDLTLPSFNIKVFEFEFFLSFSQLLNRASVSNICLWYCVYLCL